MIMIKDEVVVDMDDEDKVTGDDDEKKYDEDDDDDVEDELGKTMYVYVLCFFMYICLSSRHLWHYICLNISSHKFCGMMRRWYHGSGFHTCLL